MGSVLRLLGLTFVLVAFPAAAGMGTEDARHLLQRAGFGARPADVAEFAQLTRREAVERLLTPVGDGDPLPVPAELLEYVSPQRLRAMSEEERKELRRSRGIALRAWWVAVMLDAPTPADQLREHMALFWHNHFVSSIEKVHSPKLMVEQNRLLRRYALKDFGSLLHAVAKDPAMIVYLDSATNRKASPNENFAREVMELFTLGEGNYAESDVKEAARAFTGWSIEPETGDFRWRPLAHDPGEKTVLGVTGRLDGDAVLDILLAQPQTARFVVAKLWREFISPAPEANEVRRIAERYRASGYDARVALRELLGGTDFWSAANRLALVKSPVDWVIGNINSLGGDHPEAPALAFALRQLGQDLFAPPNVKGWPGGEAWINSSTLLARKQMGERMMRREGRAGLREALLEPSGQLK